MSETKKVWRPLKFQSPQELDNAIEAYFESCFAIDEKDWKRKQIKPMTYTGLALALDTTRDILMWYEERADFSNSIQKAKLRCEDDTINWALMNRYNAWIWQFILKNYWWKDKTELDQNINWKLDWTFAINYIVPTNNLIWKPNEIITQ